MTTRLQQLITLRDRLDLEIRAERARAFADGGRLDTQPRPSRSKHRPPSVQEKLCDLGVTARQVKEWALAMGLITEVKRGRISGELVDAYAAERLTKVSLP